MTSTVRLCSRALLVHAPAGREETRRAGESWAAERSKLLVARRPARAGSKTCVRPAACRALV